MERRRGSCHEVAATGREARRCPALRCLCAASPYLSGSGYRRLGYLRWRLSILECAAERAAAEAELALQASELIVFNRDPVRHRAVRRIAADARRAADRAREAAGELDWSGTLAATTAAQEHALRARAAWRKGD